MQDEDHGYNFTDADDKARVAQVTTYFGRLVSRERASGCCWSLAFVRSKGNGHDCWTSRAELANKRGSGGAVTYDLGTGKLKWEIIGYHWTSK